MDEVRGSREAAIEMEHFTPFDTARADIRPDAAPGRDVPRAAAQIAAARAAAMIDVEAITSQMRTATAMRSTARALLDTAAILHRCAQLSTVARTRDRLDRLGGEVSARAHAIGLRADRLTTDAPAR